VHRRDGLPHSPFVRRHRDDHRATPLSPGPRKTAPTPPVGRPGDRQSASAPHPTPPYANIQLFSYSDIRLRAHAKLRQSLHARCPTAGAGPAWAPAWPSGRREPRRSGSPGETPRLSRGTRPALRAVLGQLRCLCGTVRAASRPSARPTSFQTPLPSSGRLHPPSTTPRARAPVGGPQARAARTAQSG
jgi:hypothetical protein